MEHEVFVAVAAEQLRQALGDPAVLARAVPGLQRDAGDERPLAGRLKVRVGGSSVTYRGTAQVTAQDDGSYVVEADGTESRGGGAVELALTVRMREEGDGTTLLFAGTVTAEGRIKEFAVDTARAAGVRLLNKFAGQLGEVAAAPAREPSAPEESSAPEEPPAPGEPPASTASPISPTSPTSPSVFDAEIPPPSLSPGQDDGDETGGEAGDEAGEETGEETGGEYEGERAADAGDGPGPEAAHARRTMIGRSAEEVDHAPPRGRYAPVPAPETGTVNTALRWAAPAAALALASAVVLTRALRRRR